jgi:hypothetical protein
MAIVIGLLIGYAISFLLNAGLVWLLCWGLKAIGITAIGGWTVAFSWPLVLLFTVVYMILHGIFGKRDKE